MLLLFITSLCEISAQYCLLCAIISILRTHFESSESGHSNSSYTLEVLWKGGGGWGGVVGVGGWVGMGGWGGIRTVVRHSRRLISSCSCPAEQQSGQKRNGK